MAVPFAQQPFTQWHLKSGQISQYLPYSVHNRLHRWNRNLFFHSFMSLLRVCPVTPSPPVPPSKCQCVALQESANTCTVRPPYPSRSRNLRDLLTARKPASQLFVDHFTSPNNINTQWEGVVLRLFWVSIWALLQRNWVWAGVVHASLCSPPLKAVVLISADSSLDISDDNRASY